MEEFPVKHNPRRQFYLILTVVVILMMSGGGYLAKKVWGYQKQPVPPAVSFASVISAGQTANQDQTTLLQNQGTLPLDSAASPEVAAKSDQPTANDAPTIPPELNLEVPFYAQAPYANWDYPWQEACEEASILLVADIYFDRQWDRQTFNQQILDLVEWEKKRFGDYKHTSVQQTSDMLAEYLELKSVIHENPTFEDVQKVLARGHLIVMTFDGKTLGNPNYKNGGPVYHAMVIKGYKEGQKIITNDVGTRNGEDYIYDWATIQNSLHDYSEPMKDGAKRMIEVLPPDLQPPMP